MSHNFVGEVRKSLSSDYSEPRQYVTKHGTTATMDTTNIGKSRTAYKCRVCLDDFDRGDLWHCPVCSHHYRINSGTCSNCHKAEAASSTDMIATGKTIAETIRGYEKSGKDKAIEVVDRATGEVIENAEIVTTKRERAAAQETFASDAMTFAAMAISQLERIRTGDPKRTEALESVAEWISENL